jgi:hypothetical protein
MIAKFTGIAVVSGRYVPIQKTEEFLNDKVAEEWLITLSEKAIPIKFFTNMNNYSKVEIMPNVSIATFGLWGYKAGVSLQILYKDILYTKSLGSEIHFITDELNVLQKLGIHDYIDNLLKEKIQIQDKVVDNCIRYIQEAEEKNQNTDKLVEAKDTALSILNTYKDKLVNLNF